MSSAMRRAVLMFLLCCAPGVGAWAAEDSESPDPSPDPNTAEASRGTETAEEPGGEEDAEEPPVESPEIFVPSEDISESIAVKFPVDI